MDGMSQQALKYWDSSLQRIEYEQLHQDWHNPTISATDCIKCWDFALQFGKARVTACTCAICQGRLAIEHIEAEIKGVQEMDYRPKAQEGEFRYVKAYGKDKSPEEVMNAIEDNEDGSSLEEGLKEYAEGKAVSSDWVASEYDAINPPHYRRGPRIPVVRLGDTPVTFVRSAFRIDDTAAIELECIDVFRHIKDPRLATAFKYIWRVAFGGKQDPEHQGDQTSVDARDIGSAKWYLDDYLKNPPKEEQ